MSGRRPGGQHESATVLACCWFIETFPRTFGAEREDAGDTLPHRTRDFVPLVALIPVRDQTVREPTDIRARIETGIFDLNVRVRPLQTSPAPVCSVVFTSEIDDVAFRDIDR